MKTIRFTVPPTKDVGSYAGTCTSRSDALLDYNSCRAHDGMPPVYRMPAGTVYHKQSRFFINRHGNGYRETVDAFTTRKEALAMLSEYRMADTSANYYLSSRACGNWGE